MTAASCIYNKCSDNRLNLSVKQENLSVFWLYYELTFRSMFYIVSLLYYSREYSEDFDLLSFSVSFHVPKRVNGVKPLGGIRKGTFFIREDPRKAEIEKNTLIRPNYIYSVLSLFVNT